MRFWDSSALVPLLVPEAMSRSMQALYEADSNMVVWWATEIECTSGEDVREVAKRLVRVHDLRTADALQLAAALFVAEARPSTLEIVSLDDRLLLAARREGFPAAPASLP